MKSFPQVSVETEYFPLGGGLNLTQPALSIKPGMCIDASNYVPAVTGGYRRIGGFERFDGRAKPSAASYYILPATITGTIAVGNTITGVNSTATGKVIGVGAAEIIFTQLAVSTFQSGEVLNISGSPVATTTSTATTNGSSALSDHCNYRNLAADVYRALIQVVPGTGRIRGIWLYNGTVYAFRDADANPVVACAMYKSTASGWSAVSLGTEIQYTVGNVAAPAEGETLTQGGVTATVRRLLTRTGTWAGTAAGTLVISGVAGGNFAAGAATLSGGGTLTLAGAQTAITLANGGRFEFQNYNFGGSSGTNRMYWVDGVNKCHEFDGTYCVPIRTGMTTDTPTHLRCHKWHLFLSFGSSLQHSSIGAPYTWTVVTGAAEIGIGDTITNLLTLPGVSGASALAVFSKNSTHVLYGTSSSDFNLQVYSSEAGALAYMAQALDFTYALDNAGIRQLVPGQEYGNFAMHTLSKLVKPWLDDRRNLATASSIHRAENQLRLYFSDNTGLAMTVFGPNKAAIMPFDYGMPVRCICSLEDTDGEEKIFFGSDDGYVYQAEIGTSLDGSVIDHWVRLAFWHSKSPRIRKRYRKAIIECDVEEYSEISISHDCSYGSPDFEAPAEQTANTIGNGGYWDQANSDNAVWDAQSVAQPAISLVGTGTNISMLFRGSSDEQLGHTLQGVMLHYSNRRLARD